MTTHSAAIDPAQLSAWLDGELDVAQSVQAEAWLAEHPADAALVQAWAADRDALRERLAPMALEPLPAATLGLLREEPSPQQQRWLQAAMAAGLLLLGGLLGAGLMWQVQAQSQAQSQAHSQGQGPWASATTERGQRSAVEWVHRAALAHTVYVPEVRHAVEVKANEEHLARWLTRRLTMPVKLFDLREQGFELVGGRLLPDAKTPSAQLMYQATGGKERVTVYLRKPEANTPAAFRFEREGELSLFYWVDGPTGYALVGTLPREKLLAMAESIYKQGIAPVPLGSAGSAAPMTGAISPTTSVVPAAQPTSAPKTP